MDRNSLRHVDQPLMVEDNINTNPLAQFRGNPGVALPAY
jgi:hypothetical protein